MKTISPALDAHLGQTVTTLARCWKIVRRDGTSFFFTSHDIDIPFEGDVYSSSSGFQNTAMQSKSDLSVDNLDVMGVFSGNGITVQDLRAGLFDYADVYLFVLNWEDLTQGKLSMRRGKLGECISTSQGFFQTELRGLNQILQQNVVELFGPECRADLFDGRCKLHQLDWRCTAVVTSIIDPTHFVVNITTPPTNGDTGQDDWFKYGTVEFTSGDNAGIGMEVKSSLALGEIAVYLTVAFPIQIGDTLFVWPGCDKSLSMCHDRYDNVLNMHAEPYLPGNDQILLYPDSQGTPVA